MNLKVDNLEEKLHKGVPPQVLKLCQFYKDKGYKAYVVGGSLRDLLMEKKVTDWDIAVSAKPQETLKFFRKVIPTGLKHGTVTVLFQGLKFEVTTLRGETTYSDGRHPDKVEFIDDIVEDLARRDFTINAIAYDPVSKKLFDPFDGLGDLNKRIIRAVGDPEKRFNEDGLRSLRAIRFVSTLGFEIEENTFNSIPYTISTFRKVSKERIREELIKLIQGEYCVKGVELLRRSTLLEEIFPELVKTCFVAQNRYHDYNLWDHLLKSLEFCSLLSQDYLLRFAALFHDIGKAFTKRWDETKGDFVFYNHERESANIVYNWMRKYKFSNKEVDYVTHLIRYHGYHYTPEWTSSAIRRFIQKLKIEFIEPFFLLKIADLKARKTNLDEELTQQLNYTYEFQRRVLEEINKKLAVTVNDLEIDGNEIMEILGLRPGKTIGEIKRWLLEKVLENPELNKKEILREMVRNYNAERVGRG